MGLDRPLCRSKRHPTPPQAPTCCGQPGAGARSHHDKPRLANKIIEHDRLPYSDHGQYPSHKPHPPRDLFVNEGGKKKKRKGKKKACTRLSSAPSDAGLLLQNTALEFVWVCTK